MDNFSSSPGISGSKGINCSSYSVFFVFMVCKYVVLYSCSKIQSIQACKCSKYPSFFVIWQRKNKSFAYYGLFFPNKFFGFRKKLYLCSRF